MYPPFKRTLAPPNRFAFERCLKGAAVFCASITLLVVLAIVTGHKISGSQRESAALLQSSPSAFTRGH